MKLYKFGCGCVGFEPTEPPESVEGRDCKVYRDTLVLDGCSYRDAGPDLHVYSEGIYEGGTFGRMEELDAEGRDAYIRQMNDAFVKAHEYDKMSDTLKRMVESK